MRIPVIAAVAATTALSAAEPAAAVTEVFAAYGEGNTVCRIEISKSMDSGFQTGGEGKTNFHGRTDCNVPVQQTGRATIPADGSEPALDGGLCSTTAPTCFSGQNAWGVSNSNEMTYRLSLRAPLGQGWVGSPANCTGVGTDNLKCEFSVNGVLWLGI